MAKHIQKRKENEKE